jgi:hypothetical protein
MNLRFEKDDFTRARINEKDDVFLFCCDYGD